MDKLIYFYKDDLTFDHVGIIKNDETLPSNSTTVAPNGYEPFIFDKEKNSWHGSSKDSWNLAHDDALPPLTQQDTVNILLSKQLAETKLQLKETQQDLSTANSGLVALTREVAELKGVQS